MPDYSKDLYKNGITTGTSIDGQIITPKPCANGAKTTYRSFCEAVKNRTPFHSGRFDFRGYDGSPWWNLAIRTMAITGLGTRPQDFRKSTEDAVTVITTCLSTSIPSSAAI